MEGVSESASRPVLQFSAGGLVVDPEGRVLMIRARDLRERPVWTLPKGTLAPGETPADAALREVREGMRLVQDWLAQLPAEVAEQIAWKTGERLFPAP